MGWPACFSHMHNSARCQTAAAQQHVPSFLHKPIASWSCSVQRRSNSNSARAYGSTGACLVDNTLHQQQQTQKISKRGSKKVSLRTVPGVGPKYEGNLQQHGIKSLPDLLNLHYQQCHGDPDKTETFLQDVVGITHRNHLSSILKFLGQAQPADWPSTASSILPIETAGLQPKVTLSVEGNISAGKSTFLQILQHSPELAQKLQVVPEPVDKWQNVGQGKVNLLDEFYKAPDRFAYTFQNYVFLTRMMQERESYTSKQACRLLERSIFSDRMVFVRAVHAAKHMNDTELAIYDSWFDPVLSTLPTLVPNGFIYLRAAPTTCHKRLQKRGRSEEGGVQLGYLEELHSRHEDWLMEGADAATGSKYIWAAAAAQGSSAQAPGGSSSTGSDNRPVVCLGDAPPAQGGLPLVVLPEVPGSLRGSLRFMDTSRGPHMHPLLHQVPSLVIDCDEDVDVERDTAYREHITSQVSQYVDYVRQYMTARGQVIAAADHLQMSASGTSSTGSLSAPYNGYYVTVKGTVLYIDRDAPLLGSVAPAAVAVAAKARRSSSSSSSSKTAAAAHSSGTSPTELWDQGLPVPASAANEHGISIGPHGIESIGIARGGASSSGPQLGVRVTPSAPASAAQQPALAHH